ncbi:hypothetical protein OSB04_un001475 [Centaurea solstitialis]|uniref:Uncharacterized protein n=1 Tax=Centaurea solstitialis TaxID=347529 RepID=A0AA38VUM3_9ASTR|nr:hypothetical protein OSB04_un001475 [Centaurea solstitialis]
MSTSPEVPERKIPKPPDLYNETEQKRVEIDYKALSLLTIVDSRNSAKVMWGKLEKQLQRTESILHLHEDKVKGIVVNKKMVADSLALLIEKKRAFTSNSKHSRPAMCLRRSHVTRFALFAR